VAAAVAAVAAAVVLAAVYYCGSFQEQEVSNSPGHCASTVTNSANPFRTTQETETVLRLQRNSSAE
jgi:hypothetical protein